ncbi:MAG: hypothetical protein ABSF50_15205 [Burkholderiaceae bacterium]|jgi:hypothetical protein
MTVRKILAKANAPRNVIRGGKLKASYSTTIVLGIGKCTKATIFYFPGALAYG